MSEKKQSHKEALRRDLRDVLGITLTTIALSLVNGDSLYSLNWPQDTLKQLPAVEYSQPELHIRELPVEVIDLPTKERLMYLLNTLGDQERNSDNDKVNDALRIINGPTGRCTGLQIDESGVYLTARHCLFYTYKDDEYSWNTNLGDIQVKNPYTGEVDQSIGFIAHPKADTALLFAPTGKQPKPIEGIKITSHTYNNEKLWLSGFIPPDEPENSPTLFTEGGVLDEDIEFEELRDQTRWEERTYTTSASMQSAVIGIKPHGGTSGSPILNSRSEIVGVESGVVFTSDDFTNTRSNYDGAKIVPAEAIFELPHFKPILLPTVEF